MTTPHPHDGPDASLLDQLLRLSTLAQQITLLGDANLADNEGLLRLLDNAAALIRTNPAQTRQLATLCAAAAAQAGVAELIPRATYLIAQTHALAGELDQALTLINQARQDYLASGQELSALRTTAGLMHVLGESGRYQEALEAGQAALDKIGLTDEPPLVGLLAMIQQNRGLCYNALGRYDEALQAYHAAETHYLALEMTVQAGDISNNRGILLWEMGQGTAALEALEKALAIRSAHNQTMLQAQTLSNMGSVHLLLGNYTTSLETFEKARRLFASLDALVDQHVLLLDTANAYLTLNLYHEAMGAYQEAAHLLKTAGVVHQLVRALWGLGATLLALGQPGEAEMVLAEAVTTLEMTGDGPTPLLATLLLELAAAYTAHHAISQAQTTAQRALALVTGHEWPVPTIYAHLQLADLAGADTAQAESHLLAAQQLADPFGLPHLRYRLQQRLGRLRRQQGRPDEARLLFADAITVVEQLRGTLAQETLRTSFLHDKVTVYDELILLHLAQGTPEGDRRALAVAEQAKSRTLLDLMTGVVATGHEGDDSAAASQHQLQADLNAVYNELLQTGGMAGDAGRIKTMQSRAAALEAALQQHQLRQTRPHHTAEQWASPLPLEVIQPRLGQDTTLLVFHIIGEEILAFVITGQTLHVLRALGTVSEVQATLRRLEGMLDRLRASSFFTEAQMGWLELSARRVLAQLYTLLIAPLAHFLPPSTGTPPQLTLVPHGCLHQVPFQALFDGKQYWLERYEISYVPSATIDYLCQTRPRISLNRALLVGVPDPSIPAVTQEITAIAALLPQAAILLDTQATQANVQTTVAGCDLLHLACHGLFRADNPMFSALKLHDGWLTAAAAMQLNLSNALVTLSACESGRSQVAGGDERLGLLRAFLGAGAATIVVSMWLAQDESTAQLMRLWYEQLLEPGATPAQALRMAQLALKTSYPHPFHWAPFVVVGRR